MYYQPCPFPPYCSPCMPAQNPYSGTPHPAGYGSFPVVRASGDTEVPFTTNESGEFRTSMQMFTMGQKVNLKGYVLFPDANYTVSLQSSGGGTCTSCNVRANQVVECNIGTVSFGNTVISIYLKSSLLNSTGKAHIHYEY